MADTHDLPAERPDLHKRSLLFSAVSGAAMGAVIWTGIEVAAAAISHRRIKNLPYKELLKSSETAGSAIMGAVVGGGLGYAESKGHNQTVSRVTPYVERLEKEREEAKNALSKGQAALS